MTNQTFRVFDRTQSQIVDEGFDHVPAGISDRGGSAVISGVGFDEVRIELVLADQEAEAVAEAGLAAVVAVISVRNRLALIGRPGIVGSWGQAEFFHRAEADAVRLAESAVDSAGFRNTHLSAVDQRGDVGRIGRSRRSLAGAGRRDVVKNEFWTPLVAVLG